MWENAHPVKNSSISKEKGELWESLGEAALNCSLCIFLGFYKKLTFTCTVPLSETIFLKKQAELR